MCMSIHIYIAYIHICIDTFIHCKVCSYEDKGDDQLLMTHFLMTEEVDVKGAVSSALWA